MSMQEGFEEVDLGRTFIGASNTELRFSTRQMNVEDLEKMLDDVGLTSARTLMKNFIPSDALRDLDEEKKVIRMSLNSVIYYVDYYAVSVAYQIEEGTKVFQFDLEDYGKDFIDTEVTNITAGDGILIMGFEVPV
jgi:hypothetical protein